MTTQPLREFASVANALGVAFGTASDELVSWIAQTARAVFGATACSIALLTSDGDELVFTTASGGDEANVPGLRMPAGEGIAGWVATTGQPLAVSDLSQDPRFAAHVASATGFMPTEILACPIATDDELLGVMEILDRNRARAGSDADLELLSLFARQAALAIDAAERSRRVGTVLLRALAGAADGELATAFAAAARDGSDDDDLREAATAFAQLARSGPAERTLAAQVLRDVGAYAARSSH